MEIDTNSTSLATLALPVIDGGYAPGCAGNARGKNHLGEAKSCALQTMADSQMAASGRRAAMRSA